jgi:ankyrin repeat protein
LTKEGVNTDLSIIRTGMNKPASSFGTPLTEAVLFSNKELVKVLTHFGADPNQYNAAGKSALHLVAEQRGHHESLDVLMQLLVTDPLSKSKEGKTAI